MTDWEGLRVAAREAQKAGDNTRAGELYLKTGDVEAAKKAFMTNRVGDFGFLLGILVVWTAVGTGPRRNMRFSAVSQVA